MYYCVCTELLVINNVDPKLYEAVLLWGARLSAPSGFVAKANPPGGSGTCHQKF